MTQGCEHENIRTSAQVTIGTVVYFMVKKATPKRKITKRSSSTSKSTRGLLRGYKPNKRLLIPLIIGFLVLGLYIVFRSFAATPQQTYNSWGWPTTKTGSVKGFTSFEHTLTIESVAPNAPYFWSHQFGFEGGDGGYIGLQSNGSRVNGTVGKTAVFSIFSSGIAGLPASSCSVEQAGFDGYNTSGTSCRIPFEWSAGTPYVLKVSRLAQDSTGSWWVGTINGQEIARIKVPLAWSGLRSSSIMWTEYFGARPNNCKDIPYSRVRFSQPIANGNIQPTGGSPSLSTGTDCTNSKMTQVGTSWIHEVGTSTSVTPAPTPGPTGCKTTGMRCSTPAPTPTPAPAPNPQKAPYCNLSITKSGTRFTATWLTKNVPAGADWGVLLSRPGGNVAKLPVSGSATIVPPAGGATYTVIVYDKSASASGAQSSWKTACASKTP